MFIIPYRLRSCRRNIFGNEIAASAAELYTIAFKKGRFSSLVYIFVYEEPDRKEKSVYTSYNISDARRYATAEEAQAVIDDILSNPDNYILK